MATTSWVIVIFGEAVILKLGVHQREAMGHAGGMEGTVEAPLRPG
jgi:hypothetical protein